MQQVLGPTKSSGQTHAPQTRLEVIGELLTRESVASIKDIANPPNRNGSGDGYDVKLRITKSAVYALEQCGLLSVEHVEDNNTQRFHIINPEMPQGNYKRRTLALSGIYEFMRLRAEDDIREFAYEECLGFVLPWVKARQPDVDESLIRQQVKLRLHHSTPIAGLKPQGTPHQHKKTQVHLEASYQKPLEELLNIVTAVAAGSSAMIETGFECAEEITNDDKAKGLLMSKARQFSSQANRQSIEQTSAEVLNIVAAASAVVDAKKITEAYNAQHGRTLSTQSIQLVLQHLIRDGKVVAEKRRVKPSVRRTRSFYEVVTAPELRAVG